MQTAINPALAAAMTLERAAQVGEFQPMTREGQPTVAAQLMQKAVPPAPPAVPEIAQQAGLAGQIRSMQMQDAQKALMQQAMAQRPPAGIEGLNPQMGGFAEGGIIGYSNGDLVEDVAAIDVGPEFGGSSTPPQEVRLRVPGPKGERMMTPEEMRAEGYPDKYIQGRLISEGFISAPAAQTAPVVPPAPAPAPAAPPRGGIQTLPAAQKVAAPRPTEGLASSSKEDIDAMQKIGRELAAIPASPDPQKNTELAMQKKAAADEFARQTGNDPDMVLKQIAQYEDMYRRRDEQLARRMADLDANKREQGLIEFLLGARGMKGEGIGTVFGSGARASRAYEAQTRAQMERMEELRMDLESAKADRVNALRKFKYETDMGHYKSAEQERQNALEAQRKQKMIELEIAKTSAGLRSDEARTRATIEEQARGRAEAAAARKGAEQDRTMLAAQGRLTEAEKARAQVAEKNKAMLALPKDARDPLTKQMRENAEREIAQAEENVAAARALYNRILNQNLGIAQPAARGVEAGTVREYQGAKYRFKGGDQYDKANWEKI